MENQPQIAKVIGTSVEKEQWNFPDGSVATVERTRHYEHEVTGAVFPVNGSRQLSQEDQPR